jgi:hypothetical protein
MWLLPALAEGIRECLPSSQRLSSVAFVAVVVELGQVVCE